MADMADVDARLAEVLTILESLEHDYKSASDDLERTRIKNNIEKVMSETPDEHLVLLGLYDDARVHEAGGNLERLRQCSQPTRGRKTQKGSQ